MQCKINGIAFVDNSRWIGSINTQQALNYNFMTNPPQRCMIKVPHPTVKGKYVTLEILASNKKTAVDFKDGKLNYSLNIRVAMKFTEAQDQIKLDEETIVEIQKLADEQLTNECSSLFKEYQSKKEDIFGVQDEFERFYPKIKKQNIIENTNFKINFNVSIEGTHKTFNWG